MRGNAVTIDQVIFQYCCKWHIYHAASLFPVPVVAKKMTVKPPSERPGVRRTTEMKQLYGAGAAMIHGMETAMQLNFDRNCDLKQPKLWPNLPLTIKFK